MKPEEMAALYDYNAWADRRVLEAVSALSKEEFLKPMGSSFSSIRDTLAHIFGVEWLWLERFQGRSPASIPDGNEFTEINVLKARWMEFEPTLLKFARGLTESDLDPGDGVQDNEVWCVYQSLVAIDAAFGQSRNLPPRPGHNDASAAGSPANSDGLDALLSGTPNRRERMKLCHDGDHPDDRVDEGKSTGSAAGTARDRLRADDGSVARRAHGTGRTREKRVRPGLCLHLSEPNAIWAE